MKYNELKSGTIVKVNTGCVYNDDGSVNPRGFWGAWIPETPCINLNNKTLEKIVKEKTFKIIESNVCITTLEIIK